MPNASIAVTLQEDFSSKIERMRDSGGRFSKELDELEQKAGYYGQRLEALSKQQANYAVELSKAQKALDAAQAAFNRKPTEERENALKQATEHFTELSNSLDVVTSSIRKTRSEYNKLDNDLRRIENGTYGQSSSSSSKVSQSATSGGGDGSSMLSALARSGLIQMAGQSLSNAAGAYIGSAYDQDTGTYISGVLGGVASGAAMGSVAGPWGTLAGAVVGGLSGLVNSATEIFERKDDAFQSYVQDQYNTLTQAIEDTLAAGIEVAGSREQTRLAFAQRFGSEEAADEYLGRVQEFAGVTNYSYDDIVGYSQQLLNTYDPEQVFSVLMSLSDATAALNLDSSDVSTLINGLSRMRVTNKATQEYLNYFNERGIDVYQALANSTGADKSAIAGMVSKGEIGGVDAAAAILDYINQEFGGLSETLAGTYDAMVDNLEDARTNLNAAMGEGYNETRKAGIEAEQEFLDGVNGQAMEDAYGMIGQWKASLENLKEEYNRDALTAVMGGGVSENFMKDGELTEAGQRLQEMAGKYDELRAQYESGSEDAGAQMGALLAEAQAIAIDAYNASEGYDLELQSQVDLISRLRADAALQDEYYNAGYTMGQEFNKGMANAILESGFLEQVPGIIKQHDTPWTLSDYFFGRDLSSHADGLSRVPYDGYPAILHQDERILTAAEARSYDAGGGAVTVTVTGNTINVQDQNYVDAIASAIAEKVVQAQQLRG